MLSSANMDRNLKDQRMFGMRVYYIRNLQDGWPNVLTVRSSRRSVTEDRSPTDQTMCDRTVCQRLSLPSFGLCALMARDSVKKLNLREVMEGLLMK